MPAQAGSWQFSCGPDSKGQATHQVTDALSVQPAVTTKWVPPGGAGQPAIPANSLTLPGVSNSPYTSSAGPNAVFTEDVNVTAVITATWTHGTGQTDANDPAPSSVWLIETSSAGWSAEGSGSGAPVPGTGSASDGLSNPTDIPVISYDSNGLKNGENYNSKNAPVTTPPAHWFVQSVSGGTFTFTRTFTAHCVGKLPASATGGGIINTTCGFGGYTVSIHAQPYGWYDAGHLENGVFVAGPYMDNTNGIVRFQYAWKSTDGNLAHLTGIKMYEYLSYSGPGTFSPDKAKFYPALPAQPGWSTPNGIAGSFIDPTHWYATDAQSPFPTTSPLTAVTWTAAQKYEFDDPATGEVGTVLYDSGNITDAVQLNPNQFYVSKSGYSATKPL